MKKLLGEFLVEKGLLSNGDLLDALMLQSSNTSSVAEIVHKNKFLDCETILSTLKFQAEHSLGFYQALSKLGHLSDELTSKIKKIMDKERKPLGQILLETKKIDCEQLIQAFDDFIYETKNSTAGEEQDTSPSGADAENTLKLTPNFKTFAPELLGQFLQSFSEEAMANIEQVDIRKDDLSKVKDNLREILAGAKFLTLELTVLLAGNLLKAIETLGSNFPHELYSQCAQLLKRLRILLVKNSSEEEMWSSPEEKQNFLDIYNDLMKYVEENKCAS